MRERMIRHFVTTQLMHVFLMYILIGIFVPREITQLVQF